MAFELLPTNSNEIMPNYDATADVPQHALDGQSVVDFGIAAGARPELLLQVQRAMIVAAMRTEPDSVKRLLLYPLWKELDQQLRPEAYGPFSLKSVPSKSDNRIYAEIARRQMLETDPRVF